MRSAMRSVKTLAVLGVLSAWLFAASSAPAQQVTIGTPFHSLSDGFFENAGTSWGVRGKNFFFQQGGGPNQAAPAFGGFDPSAGLSGGWGFGGGGLNGSFNFNYSQGYRQSFVSQTPMVTLMNGQQAFFSDTSQSPFVISQIPVVGGFPTMLYGYPGGAAPVYPMYSPGQVMPVTNPHNHRVQQFIQQQQAEQQRQARRRDRLERAAQQVGRFDPNQAPRGQHAALPRQDAALDGGGDLNLRGAAERAEAAPPAARPASPAERLATAQESSAGRPVPSVAEARRLHQLEQGDPQGEAMALFERGRTAEDEGKPGVAKIYYNMAVKQAAGPLRGQIQARLDGLSSAGGP